MRQLASSSWIATAAHAREPIARLNRDLDGNEIGFDAVG
jgi:hypothetical protein